jgi:hypothetical protein
MASGPSTSATSSWPGSMNVTTSSAHEGAGDDFRGYSGMAPLLFVALRGSARCVIMTNPRSVARRHHRLHFQQVLPMFPVNSVTYLPGCTRPPSPPNKTLKQAGAEAPAA